MQTTAVWALLAAAALLYLGVVLAGTLMGPPAGAGPEPGFGEPFLRRAAAYQKAGLTVFLLQHVLTLLFLAAVLLLALRHFRVAPQPSFAAASGYILFFLVLQQLLHLPLDFFRGFILEHRFALSAQTAASWFSDYGKSVLIGLLISAVALAGSYFLITRHPLHWWFPAGTIFSLFLLLSAYLYPVLIEPLFYHFTPLEDESLLEGITALAGRAGIAVDRVLVADAGRRTSKANAYFSGMGRTKRIVVYDTLLDNFTSEEVLAVIAHEMGHWRHRHLWREIMISSAFSFSALYALYLLLQRAGLHADFRALPAALLFFALLSLAAAPVQCAYSRSLERQADRTAFSLIGDPAPFVSLYRKLALSNLSVVQPHPLLEAALYTHPPLLERIDAARRHAGTGEKEAKE